MAASSSDYFIDVTAGFATTIGAGGVAAADTTTIPLTSVNGLSTTTAIELVINRVDGTGAVTNNYETVRGVISGTNLTSCVRGVEGTAQAWSAGTVVEYLITADIQNRMVDGITVEHGQDGVHSSALVTSLKATGAVVNTGTSDITIVTPKAIVDSTVTTASKTQTFTNKRHTKRVYSTASTASLTPEISTYDIFVLTTLAENLTINNPSTSTPVDGEMMLFEILSDGSARDIAFGNKYVAKAGTALPTVTVASKNLTMLFIYRADLTQWVLVYSGTEA